MLTCTECVHVEVCKLRAEFGEYAEQCEHFKSADRFVELPIKPGEKIYYFDTVGRIYKSTVNWLFYTATGLLIDSDVMFNSNLIGARFFLTREEAEQALKEREKDE